MRKKRRNLLCIALVISAGYVSAQVPDKSFLVCGDSKVLLVDYNKSADSIPEIIWSWDAHQAMDIPEDYRLKKFNTMDDCKATKRGNEILVSSSSGAIGIIDRKSSKLKFYASVTNAHSIELLPGDFVAAASSTSRVAGAGNSIMLFHINN